MQAKQGTALLGGQKVVTEGVQSTTQVSASYPGATITVFNFGTTTLATIFSDNLGTPLSNPFTSSVVTGDFIFYAPNGRYTIQMSGAGMPSTETITDVLLNDPTASTTVTAVAFISSTANPATSGVLRLASADTGPAWKSNLGGADLAFTKNASDVVELNTAFTIHGAFTTSGNPITGTVITGTTGVFSGAITGASYSGGAIAGTTGTFTGSLSAQGISGTTGTFSGAITGAGYSGGTISGTTGTFSGDVSAVNGTLSGNISVTGTSNFTGNALFGGTLGVTGTTTLSGNLGVSGATTLANTTVGAASTLTIATIKQIANNFFNISDANGISRFFVSNTPPYTNTFIAGNGAGSIFLGSGGKTNVDDVTGNISLSGSTSGTITLKAAAVAGSNNVTLPAETGTLALKPTVTLKTGTGGGNYTTASTTFVRVDSTNLAFTVTIPNGWKLLISASGVLSIATATNGVNVALADGSADNTGIIIQTLAQPNTAGAATFIPFSLNWVVNGDGASHTINLQFSTGNAADSAIMVNNTSTLKPMMTFLLTPSN